MGRKKWLTFQCCQNTSWYSNTAKKLISGMLWDKLISLVDEHRPFLVPGLEKSDITTCKNITQLSLWFAKNLKWGCSHWHTWHSLVAYICNYNESVGKWKSCQNCKSVKLKYRNENTQKRKNNCESGLCRLCKIVHILCIVGSAPSDSGGLPLHCHESESDL